MFRAIIFISFLFFSLCMLQGQTQKAAKIYLNSGFNSYFSQQTVNGLTTTNESYSGILQGISPSLMTTRESGRYTEWELSNFRLGMGSFKETASDSISGQENVLRGFQQISFYTAIRYEYGFVLNSLLGAPNDHVSYSLGLALQPYLGSSNSSPFTSSEFRRGNIQFGAKLQFVPRIMFGGTKKWFVDFNFPISLIDARAFRQRTDDPTIPLAQQIFWREDMRLFPFDLQARVGLGIRL